MVASLLFFAAGCQKVTSELEVETSTYQEREKRTEESLLKFRSSQDLENVLKDEAAIKRLEEKLPASFWDEDSVHLRSNEEGDYIENSDLVPDERIARLLNEKGEIQIADTIYVITQYGTFFSGANNYAEIYEAIGNREMHYSNPVGEDLYQIGNVYRFDTFKGCDFNQHSISSRILDSESKSGSDTQLRGNDEIPEPNIGSFSRERASKHTWIGKALQKRGQRKSLVKVFSSDNRKRINCAVFDYNYYFRQSIGVTAKIQKKMWYGAWAKMKYLSSDCLRVGFQNVIVKYPYPKGSSYGEIFAKAFPMKLTQYIPPYNPSYEYIKRNPDGSIDRSFLPMIGKSGPTKNEVINAAIGHLGAYVKDYISSKRNEGLDELLKYDMDSFISTPRHERPKELNEIIDKMRVFVSVLAEDGIYVFFPQGEIRNSTDQTEITLRFVDQFLSEFSIGYSGTIAGLQSLSGIYGGLNFSAGNPDITLIDGEFYGCGYLGDWKGFRMYW